MFNNCYRPGCHFDMNRCNCPKCRKDREDWDKENDRKEKNDYRQECYYPIDICFSIKEGKNNWEEQNRYNDDFDNYDRDFDQNEDYYEKDNYYCGKNHYNKHENIKCKHECCFPFDVCLSVKEGSRNDKQESKECRCKKDNDKNNWDDKCDRSRPSHNCNCRNNCCLGFLAGCLFGCRK